MQNQHHRRANPYSFTWEIPTAGMLALAILLVLGIQGGRSIANLLAGGGWHTVERERLITSLPGILAGDATAGLDTHLVAASPTLLRATIVTSELLILTVCALALVWGLRRWGPSRVRGMATRDEAEGLLGRRRLRRHANVIRPDLGLGRRLRS